MRVTQRHKGENGYLIIMDATNHDGLDCNAISIAEATVFSTLTDGSQTIHGTLGSVTFPAGMTIYGAFTSITLTSGAIVAYKIS